jgi:hypothetical protein
MSNSVIDRRKKRPVEVDGNHFDVTRDDVDGDWKIYGAKTNPDQLQGRVGVLVFRHVPGATETTGLAHLDLSATDDADLVRRIATAAGLTVRTPRVRAGGG